MSRGAESTTFEQFRDEVKSRVVRLHADIRGPDGTLPGYLFSEDRDGTITAELYPVAGLSEFQKQVLAHVVLPVQLAARGARRFGWVMPGWKGDPADAAECLILIVGERERCEAEIADVVRFHSRAPRLENWQTAKEVTGIFVEPLVAAIAEG